MKRLNAGTLLLFLSLSAWAHAETRPVIVLKTDALGTEQWPEGTRAVVAELAADGLQVIEQQSRATTTGALLAEVAHTASPELVLGVVAVLREGDTGAAYVWTANGERVLRDDEAGARGAVAEGAVALRVVELFRTERLQFPLAKPDPSEPKPPPPKPSRLTGVIWLSAATALGASSGTPPLGLGAGATVGLIWPVSLDLGGIVGVMPGAFDTSAGRVNLRNEELGVRLMFDPYPTSSVSFALGVGASSLWFQANATGASGYAGKYDSTQAMLFAARARLAVHMNRLQGMLVFDSGLTSPTVIVRTRGAELARLGRPFTTIMIGAGWTF